jgi:FlaA1/EpsC-like NDP-sugar epimerase
MIGRYEKECNIFSEKDNILITGGTGSLGNKLVERLLETNINSIKIFSRDEAKQYFLSKKYLDPRLKFLVGDIRNINDVTFALQDVNIVFNTAALKQVPTCESNPFQAVQTNIHGAENIVNAIAYNKLPVKTVVCISTDKACKPTTLMGMTKAIQERIFIHGNVKAPNTTFVCARYGNILASRGSLIPLYHQFIKDNKPLIVTTEEMTRFLMNLDEAVNLIFRAMYEGYPGETFIPDVCSGKIIDIANIFSKHSGASIEVSGIRPGEKVHEILISEEEKPRTFINKDFSYFIIKPELEEIIKREETKSLFLYDKEELSSDMKIISIEDLEKRLKLENLLPGQFDPNLYK